MTTVLDDIISIEKYIEKLRTKINPNDNTATGNYVLPMTNTNYFYATNSSVSNGPYHDHMSTTNNNNMNRNIKALVLFVKKLGNKCPTNLKLTQKVFEAMDLLFQTDPLTFTYIISSKDTKSVTHFQNFAALRNIHVNLQTPKEHGTEVIWYLFQNIVSICKTENKAHNNKFASYLLNKFVNDWLKIAVEYYGVFFENTFVQVLKQSVHFMYNIIIQNIINHEQARADESEGDKFVSNEFDIEITDDEDKSVSQEYEDSGFELDMLVDYLYELVLYLKMTVDLNMEVDLIFQKSIRLVFFILDEVNANQSYPELVQIECIFIELLSHYVMHDKLMLNNDKLIFTLKIYENIMSKLAVSTLSREDNDDVEENNGKDIITIDDILAAQLKKIDFYIRKNKCQNIYDLNKLLNLDKWFQIYEYPKFPFAQSLNEQINSLFIFSNKDMENSELDLVFVEYISNELKELNIYPEKVIKHLSQHKDQDVSSIINTEIESQLLNVLKIPNLDASQQVLCLQLLGKMDCEITSDNICLTCDISEHQWHIKTVSSLRKDWKLSKSFNFIQSYVLNKDLTKISNSVRFELLKCFKRIFNHFSTLNSSVHLESYFFKFLSQCFDSKILKVRSLASQILIFYFLDGTDDIKMKIFKFLENQHPNYTIDTRLETWCRLTLASKDDILDLLLLKLVNFVQSPDFFEECMSIIQTRYVATLVHKQNPYQLLSPVLPIVVKNQATRLGTSPSIFKKLSFLTNRPLDSFLMRFQKYIVPSKILIYYQKDILQQISNITKVSRHALIETNINKIISYLLVKENFFSQEKLITIISNCDSSYKGRNLQSCFDIYQTLSEICQLYDNSELLLSDDSVGLSNKLHVLKSLYFIFNLVSNNSTTEKKIKQSDEQFKKVSAVTDYSKWVSLHKTQFEKHFARHILGIFHYFNRSMCDDVTMITYYDKLQIINGITFAIEFSAEASLASCLPQISMCLQVGLDISETRYQSLKSWYYLIKTLSINQLVATIDIPVSFIQQKWNFLDTRSKNIAYLIFDILIKDPNCLLKKPSIIYSLMKSDTINLVEKHKLYFKNNIYFINSLDCLSIFASILKTYTNVYVIFQTLTDIEKVLHGGKKDISKFKTSSVQELLGALLEVSYNFKNTDFGISFKATECISYLGAVDPTIYKIKSQNCDSMHRVYDLNVPAQQRVFMKDTINDLLVPAFWQATNPFRQSFIAFAIQEYLIGCELDSRSCNFDVDVEKKRDWDLTFNELSKVTLDPLRSSKYNISTVFNDYKSIPYPCYNKTLQYQQWINMFTSDVLKNIVKIHTLKVKGKNSAYENIDIFRVYCSLMKASNVKFCEFILPYAIAHVLIKSGEEYRDLKNGILTEILTIFKTEISLLNRYQVESLKLCYEAIFKILEYLKKIVSQHGQKSQILSYLNKSQILEIEKLIQDIPLELLAKRSLEIDSFERAVLYLEQCYRSNALENISLDLLRTYLQTAYANIQDTDAIDGVLKTFTTIDLSTKLDELLYSDNWEMAQKCLDELGQFEDNDELNLKCLESMNSHQLYEQSLVKLDKIKDSFVMKPTKADLYINIGLESSIMCGNLPSVIKWVNIAEKQLKSNVSPKLLFNYNLNKALLAVHNSEMSSAESFLRSSYAVVAHSFVTSPSATTVLKIRDLLTKLHYLFDLKSLTQSKENNSSTLHTLTRRLQNVGESFSSKFEIIAIKKSFIQSIPIFEDSLFSIFFEMTQLSRKANRVDLASKLLMDAWAQPRRNDFQLELEYSDLLWEKGEREKALKMVAEIYEQMKDKNMDVVNHEEAVVLLKYAQWCDYSNNSTPTEIISKYRKVCELDATWEESFFQLGIFYSKYLEKKVDDKHDSSHFGLKRDSMTYLLHSLKLNTTHVREALPKVITYWLDTADMLSKIKSVQLKAIVQDMCKIIDQAMKECPVHIWYTVLVQFVSRILHSHSESSKRIQKIIVLLALNYPQYILWYVASMINSSENNMALCGKNILKKYRASGGSSEFASSALNLVMNLSKICNTPAPYDGNSKQTANEMVLKKDFGTDLTVAPTAIAVPVQANFGVSLPSTSTEKEDIKTSTVISISQIGAFYEVFSSLRKPKKIRLYGSDGKSYEIMCKMEDVRQDDQYMQFAQTVSFLLSKAIESKKRNLRISTYFILSLNESFGIIELVPNVMTIRSMLSKLYQAKGTYDQIRYFHQAWDRVKKDDVKSLEVYSRFKNIFKPVLHEWFLNNFPDPIVWYNSKQTFSRSYAVMSMVGHILGLGDRHCDNILIDIRSGHVLHVDYDILFEKGKDLPIPEKVPFRLTHNIVDALGITGLEGTFRRACEVSLDVIRNNELTLLNIIEIMMYGRGKSLEEISMKTKQKHFIGRENQSISEILSVIRNKMKGIDPSDFVAISVPAQVEALFQEATDDQTLSKMYMGWLAIW